MKERFCKGVSPLTHHFYNNNRENRIENEHKLSHTDNRQGPKNTNTLPKEPLEPLEPLVPSETPKVSCPRCNQVLDSDPYFRKFHNC
jgi:hypothetical protein